MILVNGKEVIKRFPNGEAIVEIPISVSAHQLFAKVILKYESDADLFDLLLIRKALRAPTLHILYMPYSRMDRASRDYAFTLKSLCEFINWLDFGEVFIYEPHSDVTSALLNNVEIVSIIPNLLAKTEFNNALDYVFYPDAGAQKKYSGLIHAKNELVGFKKRDFKTGKIKELNILGKIIKDARVFIVDDLCSKGGTFILSAEALKGWGAREINLVVAHCEENIFNGKIFKTNLINNIYTTTTMIMDNRGEKRLHILPLDKVVSI